MTIDKEILEEFMTESQGLIDEMQGLLEDADGDLSQATKLETYGQLVDRIMGSAKSLAQTFAQEWSGASLLNELGDYAAVCKSVGYKASQIVENEHFFNVCIAFLMDATDLLNKLLKSIENNESIKIGHLFNKTFIDRLRWINNQFKGDVRGTVGSTTPNNGPTSTKSEIDELLQKLGLQ